MLPQDILELIVNNLSSWDDVYYLYLTNKEIKVAIDGIRCSLPWVIFGDDTSTQLPKFIATRIQILDLSEQSLLRVFSNLVEYVSVTTIDVTRCSLISFKKAKRLVNKANAFERKLVLLINPSHREYIEFAENRELTRLGEEKKIKLKVLPLLLPSPQQGSPSIALQDHFGFSTNPQDHLESVLKYIQDLAARANETSTSKRQKVQHHGTTPFQHPIVE